MVVICLDLLTANTLLADPDLLRAPCLPLFPPVVGEVEVVADVGLFRTHCGGFAVLHQGDKAIFGDTTLCTDFKVFWIWVFL